MVDKITSETLAEERKRVEDTGEKDEKELKEQNLQVFEGISPQSTNNHSCGCSNPLDSKGLTSTFVYAIGRIEVRFPNKSIEKEFTQVRGRASTKGLTDPETMHAVLSEPKNMYLVRQMCWVLTIEEIDTYVLMPRNPLDYRLLVEALRPTPNLTNVDVVIGMRGPLADPRVCNGLIAPIALFDQIYSFDLDSLIKSVPRPANIASKQFNSTTDYLFNRMRMMAHNAGETDEHRALNFLSVRYEKIYSHTAEMFGKDFSLSAIQVLLSPLSGGQKILDVIFVYTNRKTDVDEKYFTSVDVTGEFPFLVKGLSQYYDR